MAAGDDGEAEWVEVVLGLRGEVRGDHLLGEQPPEAVGEGNLLAVEAVGHDGLAARVGAEI